MVDTENMDNGSTLTVENSATSNSVKNCTLCGSSNPAVKCDKCGSQTFCLSCDDMYHRHPKRRFHLRKAVDSIWNTYRSPRLRRRTELPGDPSRIPVPPPRSKKRHSSLGFDSPPGYKGFLQQKKMMESLRLGSCVKNTPTPSPERQNEINASQNAGVVEEASENPVADVVDSKTLQKDISENDVPPDATSAAPVFVPGVGIVQTDMQGSSTLGHQQLLPGQVLQHSTSATDLSAAASSQPMPPMFHFPPPPHMHPFMHPHMNPYSPTMAHFNCPQCISASWSNLMSPNMAAYHQLHMQPQQPPWIPPHSPSRSRNSPAPEATSRVELSPSSYQGSVFSSPVFPYASDSGFSPNMHGKMEPNTSTTPVQEQYLKSSISPVCHSISPPISTSEMTSGQKAQLQQILASDEEMEDVDEEEEEEEEEVAEGVDANEEAAIPEKPTSEWECAHCTYVNPPGSHICEICCKTSYRIANEEKKATKQKKVRKQKPMKQGDEHQKPQFSLFSEPSSKEADIRPFNRPQKVDDSPDDKVEADSETIIEKIDASCGTPEEEEEKVQLSTTETQTVIKTTSTDVQTHKVQCMSTSSSTDGLFFLLKHEMSIQTELEDFAPKRSASTDPMISSQSMESLLSGMSAPPYHNRQAGMAVGGSFSTQSLFERGRSRSPIPRSASMYGEMRSYGRGVNFIAQDPTVSSWGNTWLASDPMYYKPHIHIAKDSSKDEYLDGHWGSVDRLNKKISQSDEKRKQSTKTRHHRSLEDLKSEPSAEGPSILQCLQTVKNAERCGFSVEDLQVAYFNCGNEDPLYWLQDNWEQLVQSVITLAAKCAEDNEEHDVGPLTANEAKQALRNHKGNIWDAVTECIEIRQRKILELTVRGNFTQKQIVETLKNNSGNVELAYADLIRTTSKLFKHILSPGLSEESEDVSIHVPTVNVHPEADTKATETAKAKTLTPEKEVVTAEKKRSDFLTKLTAIRDAQSERRKAREEKEMVREIEMVPFEEAFTSEEAEVLSLSEAAVDDISDKISTEVLKAGVMESVEVPPLLEASEFEIISAVAEENLEEKKEDDLPEDLDGHWIDSQGEWIEEFSDEQWDDEGDGEWVTVRTRYKKMETDLDVEAMEMAALWEKEELADDVFEDEVKEANPVSKEFDLEAGRVEREWSGVDLKTAMLSPVDQEANLSRLQETPVEDDLDLDANDNWIVEDTEKLLRSPENEIFTNDEEDDKLLAEDKSCMMLDGDEVIQKLGSISDQKSSEDKATMDIWKTSEKKIERDSLEGSFDEGWEKIDFQKTEEDHLVQIDQSKILSTFDTIETNTTINLKEDALIRESCEDTKESLSEKSIAESFVKDHFKAEPLTTAPIVEPVKPRDSILIAESNAFAVTEPSLLEETKKLETPMVQTAVDDEENMLAELGSSQVTKSSELDQIGFTEESETAVTGSIANQERSASSATEPISVSQPRPPARRKSKLSDSEIKQALKTAENGKDIPPALPEKTRRRLSSDKVKDTPYIDLKLENTSQCLSDSGNTVNKMEEVVKDEGQLVDDSLMVEDLEIDAKMEHEASPLTSLSFESDTNFFADSESEVEINKQRQKKQYHRNDPKESMEMDSEKELTSDDYDATQTDDKNVVEDIREQTKFTRKRVHEELYLNSEDDEELFHRPMSEDGPMPKAFRESAGRPLQLFRATPSFEEKTIPENIQTSFIQHGDEGDIHMPHGDVPDEILPEVSVGPLVDEKQPLPYHEQQVTQQADEQIYVSGDDSTIESFVPEVPQEIFPLFTQPQNSTYNEMHGMETRSEQEIEEPEIPALAEMEATSSVADYFFGRYNEITVVRPKKKPLPSRALKVTGASTISKSVSPMSVSTIVSSSTKSEAESVEARKTEILSQSQIVISAFQTEIIAIPNPVEATPVTRIMERKQPEPAESLSFAEDYFFGSYNEVVPTKKGKKKGTTVVPKMEKPLQRSASSEMVTDEVKSLVRSAAEVEDITKPVFEDVMMQSADTPREEIQRAPIRETEMVSEPAKIPTPLTPIVMNINVNVNGRTESPVDEKLTPIKTIPHAKDVTMETNGKENTTKSKTVRFEETQDTIVPPPRSKKLKKDESQYEQSSIAGNTVGETLTYVGEEYLFGRYNEILSQASKSSSKKKLQPGIKDLGRKSNFVPFDNPPQTCIPSLQKPQEESLLFFDVNSSMESDHKQYIGSNVTDVLENVETEAADVVSETSSTNLISTDSADLQFMGETTETTQLEIETEMCILSDKRYGSILVGAGTGSSETSLTDLASIGPVDSQVVNKTTDTLELEIDTEICASSGNKSEGAEAAGAVLKISFLTDSTGSQLERETRDNIQLETETCMPSDNKNKSDQVEIDNVVSDSSTTYSISTFVSDSLLSTDTTKTEQFESVTDICAPNDGKSERQSNGSIVEENTTDIVRDMKPDKYSILGEQELSSTSTARHIEDESGLTKLKAEDESEILSDYVIIEQLENKMEVFDADPQSGKKHRSDLFEHGKSYYGESMTSDDLEEEFGVYDLNQMGTSFDSSAESSVDTAIELVKHFHKCSSTSSGAEDISEVLCEDPPLTPIVTSTVTEDTEVTVVESNFSTSREERTFSDIPLGTISYSDDELNLEFKALQKYELFPEYESSYADDSVKTPTPDSTYVNEKKDFESKEELKNVSDSSDSKFLENLEKNSLTKYLSKDHGPDSSSDIDDSMVSEIHHNKAENTLEHFDSFLETESKFSSFYPVENEDTNSGTAVCVESPHHELNLLIAKRTTEWETEISGDSEKSINSILKVGSIESTSVQDDSQKDSKSICGRDTDILKENDVPDESYMSRFYEEWIENAYPSVAKLVTVSSQLHKESCKHSGGSLPSSECSSSDSFESADELEERSDRERDAILHRARAFTQDAPLSQHSTKLEKPLQTMDKLKLSSISPSSDNSFNILSLESYAGIEHTDLIPVQKHLEFYDRYSGVVTYDQGTSTDDDDVVEIKKTIVTSVDRCCQTEEDIFEEENYFDSLDDNLPYLSLEKFTNVTSTKTEIGIQCQMNHSAHPRRIGVDNLCNISSGGSQQSAVGISTTEVMSSILKEETVSEKSDKDSSRESDSFESQGDSDSDIYLDFKSSESDRIKLPVKKTPGHLKLNRMDIDSGTGSISGSDVGEHFMDVDVGESYWSDPSAEYAKEKLSRVSLVKSGVSLKHVVINKTDETHSKIIDPLVSKKLEEKLTPENKIVKKLDKSAENLEDEVCYKEQLSSGLTQLSTDQSLSKNVLHSNQSEITASSISSPPRGKHRSIKEETKDTTVESVQFSSLTSITVVPSVTDIKFIETDQGINEEFAPEETSTVTPSHPTVEYFYGSLPSSVLDEANLLGSIEAAISDRERNSMRKVTSEKSDMNVKTLDPSTSSEHSEIDDVWDDVASRAESSVSSLEGYEEARSILQDDTTEEYSALSSQNYEMANSSLQDYMESMQSQSDNFADSTANSEFDFYTDNSTVSSLIIDSEECSTASVEDFDVACLESLTDSVIFLDEPLNAKLILEETSSSSPHTQLYYDEKPKLEPHLGEQSLPSNKSSVILLATKTIDETEALDSSQKKTAQDGVYQQAASAGLSRSSDVASSLPDGQEDIRFETEDPVSEICDLSFKSISERTASRSSDDDEVMEDLSYSLEAIHFSSGVIISDAEPSDIVRYLFYDDYDEMTQGDKHKSFSTDESRLAIQEQEDKVAVYAKPSTSHSTSTVMPLRSICKTYMDKISPTSSQVDSVAQETDRFSETCESVSDSKAKFETGDEKKELLTFTEENVKYISTTSMTGVKDFEETPIDREIEKITTVKKSAIQNIEIQPSDIDNNNVIETTSPSTFVSKVTEEDFRVGITKISRKQEDVPIAYEDIAFEADISIGDQSSMLTAEDSDACKDVDSDHSIDDIEDNYMSVLDYHMPGRNSLSADAYLKDSALIGIKDDSEELKKEMSQTIGICSAHKTSSDYEEAIGRDSSMNKSSTEGSFIEFFMEDDNELNKDNKYSNANQVKSTIYDTQNVSSIETKKLLKDAKAAVKKSSRSGGKPARQLPEALRNYLQELNDDTPVSGIYVDVENDDTSSQSADGVDIDNKRESAQLKLVSADDTLDINSLTSKAHFANVADVVIVDSPAYFAEEQEVVSFKEEVGVLNIRSMTYESSCAAVSNVSYAHDSDQREYSDKLTPEELTKSSADRADTVADFSELSEISDFPTDSNGLEDIVIMSKPSLPEMNLDSLSIDENFIDVLSHTPPLLEESGESTDVDSDQLLEEFGFGTPEPKGIYDLQEEMGEIQIYPALRGVATEIDVPVQYDSILVSSDTRRYDQSENNDNKRADSFVQTMEKVVDSILADEFDKSESLFTSANTDEAQDLLTVSDASVSEFVQLEDSDVLPVDVDADSKSSVESRQNEECFHRKEAQSSESKEVPFTSEGIEADTSVYSDLHSQVSATYVNILDEVELHLHQASISFNVCQVSVSDSSLHRSNALVTEVCQFENAFQEKMNEKQDDLLVHKTAKGNKNGWEITDAVLKSASDSNSATDRTNELGVSSGETSATTDESELQPKTEEMEDAITVTDPSISEFSSVADSVDESNGYQPSNDIANFGKDIPSLEKSEIPILFEKKNPALAVKEEAKAIAISTEKEMSREITDYSDIFIPTNEEERINDNLKMPHSPVAVQESSKNKRSTASKLIEACIDLTQTIFTASDYAIEKISEYVSLPMEKKTEHESLRESEIFEADTSADFSEIEETSDLPYDFANVEASEFIALESDLELEEISIHEIVDDQSCPTLESINLKKSVSEMNAVEQQILGQSNNQIIGSVVFDNNAGQLNISTLSQIDPYQPEALEFLLTNEDPINETVSFASVSEVNLDGIEYFESFHSQVPQLFQSEETLDQTTLLKTTHDIINHLNISSKLEISAEPTEMVDCLTTESDIFHENLSFASITDVSKNDRDSFESVHSHTSLLVEQHDIAKKIDDIISSLKTHSIQEIAVGSSETTDAITAPVDTSGEPIFFASFIDAYQDDKERFESVRSHLPQVFEQQPPLQLSDKFVDKLNIHVVSDIEAEPTETLDSLTDLTVSFASITDVSKNDTESFESVIAHIPLLIEQHDNAKKIDAIISSLKTHSIQEIATGPSETTDVITAHVDTSGEAIFFASFTDAYQDDKDRFESVRSHVPQVFEQQPPLQQLSDKFVLDIHVSSDIEADPAERLDSLTDETVSFASITDVSENDTESFESVISHTSLLVEQDNAKKIGAIISSLKTHSIQEIAMGPSETIGSVAARVDTSGESIFFASFIDAHQDDKERFESVRSHIPQIVEHQKPLEQLSDQFVDHFGIHVLSEVEVGPPETVDCRMDETGSFASITDFGKDETESFESIHSHTLLLVEQQDNAKGISDIMSSLKTNYIQEIAVGPSEITDVMTARVDTSGEPIFFASYTETYQDDKEGFESVHSYVPLVFEQKEAKLEQFSDNLVDHLEIRAVSEIEAEPTETIDSLTTHNDITDEIVSFASIADICVDDKENFVSIYSGVPETVKQSLGSPDDSFNVADTRNIRIITHSTFETSSETAEMFENLTYCGDVTDEIVSLADISTTSVEDKEEFDTVKVHSANIAVGLSTEEQNQCIKREIFISDEITDSSLGIQHSASELSHAIDAEKTTFERSDDATLFVSESETVESMPVSVCESIVETETFSITEDDFIEASSYSVQTQESDSWCDIGETSKSDDQQLNFNEKQLAEKDLTEMSDGSIDCNVKPTRKECSVEETEEITVDKLCDEQETLSLSSSYMTEKIQERTKSEKIFISKEPKAKIASEASPSCQDLSKPLAVQSDAEFSESIFPDRKIPLDESSPKRPTETHTDYRDELRTVSDMSIGSTINVAAETQPSLLLKRSQFKKSEDHAEGNFKIPQKLPDASDIIASVESDSSLFNLQKTKMEDQSELVEKACDTSKRNRKATISETISKHHVLETSRIAKIHTAKESSVYHAEEILLPQPTSSPVFERASVSENQQAILKVSASDTMPLEFTTSDKSVKLHLHHSKESIPSAKITNSLSVEQSATSSSDYIIARTKVSEYESVDSETAVGTSEFGAVSAVKIPPIERKKCTSEESSSQSISLQFDENTSSSTTLMTATDMELSIISESSPTKSDTFYDISSSVKYDYSEGESGQSIEEFEDDLLSSKRKRRQKHDTNEEAITVHGQLFRRTDFDREDEMIHGLSMDESFRITSLEKENGEFSSQFQDKPESNFNEKRLPSSEIDQVNYSIVEASMDSLGFDSAECVHPIAYGTVETYNTQLDISEEPNVNLYLNYEDDLQYEIADDRDFDNEEKRISDNEVESSLYESWSDRSFELDENVLQYERVEEDAYTEEHLLYDEGDFMEDEDEEAILREIDMNLKTFDANHLGITENILDDDDYDASPDLTRDYDFEVDQTDSNLPAIEEEEDVSKPQNEGCTIDQSYSEYDICAENSEKSSSNVDSFASATSQEYSLKLEIVQEKEYQEIKEQDFTAEEYESPQISKVSPDEHEENTTLALLSENIPLEVKDTIAEVQRQNIVSNKLEPIITMSVDLDDSNIIKTSTMADTVLCTSIVASPFTPAVQEDITAVVTSPITLKKDMEVQEPLKQTEQVQSMSKDLPHDVLKHSLVDQTEEIEQPTNLHSKVDTALEHDVTAPDLPPKKPNIGRKSFQDIPQVDEVKPCLPRKLSKQRLSISDEDIKQEGSASKTETAETKSFFLKKSRSDSSCSDTSQDEGERPSLPRKLSKQRLSTSDDGSQQNRQLSAMVEAKPQPAKRSRSSSGTNLQPVEVASSGDAVSTSMVEKTCDEDLDSGTNIPRRKREQKEPLPQETAQPPLPRRSRTTDTKEKTSREPSQEPIDPEITAVGKIVIRRRSSTPCEPVVPLPKKRLSIEDRMAKLQSEGKCSNKDNAFIAAKLIEMQFEEDDALLASRQCSNVYHAVKFLTQLCEMCNCRYPIHQMASMVHCPHKACKDCLKAHFTTLVYDRSIFALLCPICHKPDISDNNIQDYFNHLDMMLRRILKGEVYDLFQRKLRDEVLTKDPNFHWCSQCSSGFMASPRLKKLYCPDCSAITCALCHQTWELEHEGVHCERFQQWKDMHTPEPPPAGLVKALAERGITCPSCDIKYAHASGGSMFYKCAHCSFEFCAFCHSPYIKTKECQKKSGCSDIGIHSHHPYNCLFYLRDKDVPELQLILVENNVSYLTIPPPDQIVKSRCQVREQKHVHGIVTEERCGRDIEPYFAGLCRLHYKEYLVELLLKNKINPTTSMTTMELEFMLRKARLFIPERVKDEKSDEYRSRILKIVMTKLSDGKKTT